MKKSLIRAEIYKILADIMMIAFSFVKIIHEIVIMGSEDNPKSVEFYYSIYDKLSRNGFTYIVYLTIAMCVAAIGVGVTTLITKNEKIRRISEYVFLGAALVFILAFVAANLLRSQ